MDYLDFWLVHGHAVVGHDEDHLNLQLDTHLQLVVGVHGHARVEHHDEDQLRFQLGIHQQLVVGVVVDDRLRRIHWIQVAVVHDLHGYGVIQNCRQRQFVHVLIKKITCFI